MNHYNGIGISWKHSSVIWVLIGTHVCFTIQLSYPHTANTGACPQQRKWWGLGAGHDGGSRHCYCCGDPNPPKSRSQWHRPETVCAPELKWCMSTAQPSSFGSRNLKETQWLTDLTGWVWWFWFTHLYHCRQHTNSGCYKWSYMTCTHLVWQGWTLGDLGGLFASTARSWMEPLSDATAR